MENRKRKLNTNSVCSVNKRARKQKKLPTATTVAEKTETTRSRTSTTDSNHNNNSNYSKEGTTDVIPPDHELKFDIVEVESQSEIIFLGRDDILSDDAIVSSFIIDVRTIRNITTSTTPASSSNEVPKIEAPSLDLVSLDIPSATVVCTDPTPTDDIINNINNNLDRAELEPKETFLPCRDAAACSDVSVIEIPVTSESSNEVSTNEGPLDIKHNKEVHTDPEVTPTGINDKVITSELSGPPQYEADITYDPEIELQEYSDSCKKNLCHDQFVHVKDFSIDKLPEQFRKKCMVKFINAMAFLTVRITTFNISFSRPETHKGSPYPGFQDRGEKKMCVRYGTGRVHSVIKQTEEGDMKCPCESCKHLKSHHKTWGLITVYTAAHVVFDSNEAKQAVFRWGYDSDEVRSWVDFPGLGANSDIDGDTSKVTCITHNEELIDRLQNMTHRYRLYREKVIKEIQAGSELVKLVVLVSHPHGCPKHISIGEWTEQMSEIKHTYTQVCGSDGDSEYNSDNADYEDYVPYDESDQEDLDDSCDESYQEDLDDSCNESYQEDLDDACNESYQEDIDDPSNESDQEDLDDSCNESYQEDLDDPSNESDQEDLDDSCNESYQEDIDDPCNESYQEDIDDPSNESDQEDLDDSCNESYQEDLDDPSNESDQEDLDDSCNESYQEDLDDPCNESDQEDLDDSCNESDQDFYYQDDDFDDSHTIVNSETLIKYKFNACTCPGSSGATVFMYGSHDLSCDFPHSGGNTQSNYTGYAFPKE